MLKALEKTDKNSYAFIPSGVLKNGDSIKEHQCLLHATKGSDQFGIPHLSI
jgi:hypothetical protein